MVDNDCIAFKTKDIYFYRFRNHAIPACAEHILYLMWKELVAKIPTYVEEIKSMWKAFIEVKKIFPGGLFFTKIEYLLCLTDMKNANFLLPTQCVENSDVILVKKQFFFV